ncbi:G2 and S phase-expressed protein 1 [Hyperolius riggenbachi]|uniref:G2 and S phase-expressed protein 1 n=1 Tax=Hyperolius riggenbachi TaxID=752182 RepID=UPI0035A32E58
MNSASDFTLLADEQFDFDISLSPASAKEDHEECDDEVFIGPVKHKEKCVRAAIQLQELEPQMSTGKHDQAVWSPLSGDKFVEIFKEAHLLALQLECSTNEDKKEDQTQTASCPVVEKFVQESKSKLKLLDILNEVPKTPVAIKRETYCIQDSPMHQLPPAIQHQMSSAKKDVEKPQKSHSFTSPLKVSKVMKCVPVSPLSQKTKAPQVKSAVPLPGTNKTVSRLQSSMKAPAVQTKTNRLTVERPKLGKTSPQVRRNLSSMGSTEDLLSGNSSIASDISDSSFNSSSVMHGKKALPVPNKINMSKAQFKTPSAVGSLRRNTSSSSSSRSSINTSLNSSMSISPPASAKLNESNTTLNASVSNSKLKPNTGKLAPVRQSRVGSLTKMANADLLKNHLKPCTATKANSNKSASVSVAQPQTPAGKMQRQTSAPNLHRLPPLSARPESAVKTAAGKPLARVMPTPTSRLKLPQKPEGLSPDRTLGKTLKPMRLLSCGDIGSGIAQSTPVVVGKGIPATPNSKHTSALPTPVSRRMSGIVTPRTVSRTIPSLRPTPATQTLPKSSIKPLAESVVCEEVNLKVTRFPQSPSDDCTTAAEICCTLNFSPENKPVPAVQSENPGAPLQSSEVLIDIEVDKAVTKLKKPFTLQYDSQPLIDLSNTPEVNKQPAPLKPTSIAQLIDLSSPLIKLSPAANKENVEFDFPLVSF